MLPVVLCGKNSYGNQVNWKSFLSEVTRAPTVKPTRSLKRYSTWAKAAYDLVKSSYGDCVDGIPPASRPALAGAWTKSFQNGGVPDGRAPGTWSHEPEGGRHPRGIAGLTNPS